MTQLERNIAESYRNLGFDNKSLEMDSGDENWRNKKQQNIAVLVDGGTKSYKKSSPILQNLNMTVREGTIYGLLGASGCGKTTLLSCMVGMKKLDSGEIFIFGHNPGSPESGIPGRKVGYMPQELALFEEFTIRESIDYFGKIYGMTSSHVKSQMDFLSTLLDLPPQGREIRSLSGGQKRRVSFALALFHEPELLILDEPTVGVDPLLRQSIWNHLSNMVVSRHTTVIITTHYIEEAMKANTIGLMRNGKLVTENSPDNLIRIHNCLSLQDVVLKLCLRDSRRIPTVEEEKPEDPTSSNNNVKIKKGEEDQIEEEKESAEWRKEVLRGCKIRNKLNHSKEEGFSVNSSYNRLTALIWKNLICLRRNIGFVLFVFALPAAQFILFCMAIGGDPKDLIVGVINEEVPQFGICKGLNGGCPGENNSEYSSCRFLDELHELILKPYHTEKEAREDVFNGKLWGFLRFPPNYTLHSADRVIEGNFASNFTLSESRIYVQLDESNTQVALYLQKIFYLAFQNYSQKILKICEGNPALGEHPLFFKEPLFGKQPTFMEYVAPSLVLCIIFIMSVALTSQVYISEKKGGMLERSMVAGVTSGEVLTSHMVAQFLVMTIQIAITLPIMIEWFEVAIKGPIWAVVLMTILQGSLGMFIGLIISMICDEERNVTQLSLGTVLPNFVLSGVIWPIEAMPSYLWYISICLPETLASESMRSMMTRGQGIMHQNVYPGFLVTIAWILVLWILAVLLGRRSKK